MLYILTKKCHAPLPRGCSSRGDINTALLLSKPKIGMYRAAFRALSSRWPASGVRRSRRSPCASRRADRCTTSWVRPDCGCWCFSSPTRSSASSRRPSSPGRRLACSRRSATSRTDRNYQLPPGQVINTDVEMHEPVNYLNVYHICAVAQR